MKKHSTFLDACGLLVTITEASETKVHYTLTLRHPPVTPNDMFHFLRQRHIYVAGRDRAEQWVEKGYWTPTP